MDYKKDCEERLRKYAKADETLSILHERLEKMSMHGKPCDIKAIDFQKIGHCNMTSDALDDLVEVQHILKQINNLESEKEIINKVLKKIKSDNKEHYNFLQLKYIQDIPMNIVADKLGYSDRSSRTIYKIKDKALKNFAMYFWGE